MPTDLLLRLRTATRTFLTGAVVAACLGPATGCILASADQGLENHWRDESLPPFERGTTTMADVLDRLGPPSQVINRPEGLIFYYMKQIGDRVALALFLYNTIDQTVRYDRAIFFFDADGVLTEFALSKERAPYEPEENEPE